MKSRNVYRVVHCRKHDAKNTKKKPKEVGKKWGASLYLLRRAGEAWQKEFSVASLSCAKNTHVVFFGWERGFVCVLVVCASL